MLLVTDDINWIFLVMNLNFPSVFVGNLDHFINYIVNLTAHMPLQFLLQFWRNATNEISPGRDTDYFSFTAKFFFKTMQ